MARVALADKFNQKFIRTQAYTKKLLNGNVNYRGHIHNIRSKLIDRIVTYFQRLRLHIILKL